jgi:predicted phosphodiesterase
MLLVQILSDLHLEFGGAEIKETNADVVVLAGDTHVGTKGVLWALENFKDKEVIYVMGNHEYYRKAIPKLTNKVKELTKGTNVHVLENDELVLDNVRFLGCTLWTDMQLFGNPHLSSLIAQQGMNDYKLIRVDPEYRKLKPADTIAYHHESKNWLDKKLKESDMKTIVVTHNGPSVLSVPARFSGDRLNAAFVSTMDNFIYERKPYMWIHGHTHDSCDYDIGETRVVCNPYGYKGYSTNKDFLSDLVFAIN